jgi:hypothetical protein
LITGQKATSRVPSEVVAHIGLDSINGVPVVPRYGEYEGGSPVPVATIRRHACDANIIPIVLSGDGVPLVSDAPSASRQKNNALHCARCTKPAPSATVR